MSDVRNRANSLNLSFPIPGVNNSSQGFRDNAAATQQALFRASDELDKLQKTRLNFTGDATGVSDRMDNAVVVGSADPTIEVAFTLANAHTGETTVNTSTQDFSLTFDAKGRVTVASLVSAPVSWATGHAAGTAVPITGSADLGTGSGSIVLPKFTFDAKGRLTATSTQTIPFGLHGQTLAFGGLLVGGIGNKSTELAPPSGTGAYALVATGTSLSWQTVGAGTVSGVVGGIGISVTGDAEAPTVDLDLSKLDPDLDIDDTDELVYLDAQTDTPKRLTLSQLRGRLVRISADDSPELGGNLDTGSNAIFSTDAGGVVLKSNVAGDKASLTVADTGLTLQGAAGAPLALEAPSLTINGREWPTAAPTLGQYLTAGPTGTLIWTTPSALTFPVIQDTFFVSRQGDDMTGNGSLVTPFATIAKALSLVPLYNTAQYTIVLMGGTYNESLEISNIHNLSIEGMFQTTNAKITGKLQLGFNLKRIRFSRVDFQDSSTTTQPTIIALAGADDLVFQDVNVVRTNPSNIALDLNGQIIKDVEFINGSIVGTVLDNLSSTDGFKFVRKSLETKQDKLIKSVVVATERALTPADAGTYIRVNNSADNELTIDEFANQPIPVGSMIHLSQLGTGRTSIVPTGNVTINTPDGYTLRKRFSKALLIHVSQDIWDLSGDLDNTIEIAPVVRADTDTISVDNDTVTADNG